MHLGQLATSHFGLSIFWTVFAASVLLGLTALLSPSTFQRLARSGGRWIDTSKWVAKLDAPIDIDAKVIPHCRILGGAVLGALAFLAFAVLH